MNDWKPGDLAKRADNGLNAEPMFYTKVGWIDIRGVSWAPSALEGDVRPIAKVDPLNPDDIARLAGLIADHEFLSDALDAYARGESAGVAEPTGLGAVAVDDVHTLHVRHASGPGSGREQWRDEYGTWRRWTDIAISSEDQILSRGVEVGQ